MPHFIKILPIFYLFGVSLFAQNPHPFFRNYTTDDGLPSPEVHYCIQDTLGYMWLATDNGVSRFDGYRFKNYGPKEGLFHNVVFYMQQDPMGRMWMATIHGHLYYVENDSIHSFDQNNIIEQTNQLSNFITDFYIDEDGTKYLSILSTGILQFSPNGNWQLFLPAENKIRNLAIKLQNRWICGTHNVLHFNKKSNYYYQSTVVFPAPSYHINTNQVSQNKPSSARWIKTFKHQQTIGFYAPLLFEINNQNIGWIFQPDFNLEHKSVFEDSDDRIYLGLLKGKGLRRYSSVDAIRKNQYEQFLEGISISHIFKDRAGGYWISSIENGVFYCPDFDLKIYDQSSGFPNNHVAAIDFKDENNLFIGFRKGQIISLNTQTNKVKKLSIPSERKIIYDLVYDTTRQQLWVTNGHLNFIKNGKWKCLAKKKNTTSIISKKMTLGRNGDLLWGGHHYGFGRIHLDNEIAPLHSVELGWNSRTLRVWEDQKNQIWIANTNGLFQLKNNLVVPPYHSFEAFNSRIEDIGEMSDGTLVIGTKGHGVLLWKDDYFQQLTTDNGLTSNMLENIYVDEQDQIWAGTLEGLNKISRDHNLNTWKHQSLSVEKYTIFNGLPSNEITDVLSRQDQIWIATTKGLVEWKEKTPSSYSAIPVFERILVNNKAVEFLNISSFSHKENNLEIRFLAINYKLNGKITYRFKLNSENWTYTKNQSVTLPNLSPGDYQIEVQAQNENDVWSASNTLDFKIRPAYWQTSWFTFLWILALLSLTGFIYRNRVHRKRQAERIRHEMNELQRAALSAQMNPHFIFNCLNSIQKFIIQNNQDSATRYLTKFAQLVRTALNSSQEEKTSIHNEITWLENYLLLEKLRFKERFNYFINVDDSLDKFETMIPPLITQPFVENAIVHGFAKIKSGGLLRIDFFNNNGKLEIIINDNGQGISRSKRKNSNHAEHNGVGINISRKRLALANPLNQLQISENKNDDGKIQGTCIKLILEM